MNFYILVSYALLNKISRFGLQKEKNMRLKTEKNLFSLFYTLSRVHILHLLRPQ